MICWQLHCVPLVVFMFWRLSHSPLVVFMFWRLSHIPLVVFTFWRLSHSTYCVLCVHFCTVGGLAAVVYTEVLQTAVMVIGAFVLMVMSKQSDHCLPSSKLNSKCFKKKLPQFVKFPFARKCHSLRRVKLQALQDLARPIVFSTVSLRFEEHKIVDPG